MHPAARKLLEAPAPSSGDNNQDVVIILASLLCALISVLTVGLVARCACGRAAGGGASDAANRGVKKSVLRAIPTVAYVAPPAAPTAAETAPAPDSAEGQAECAICLSEFQDGDAMRVLPQCGHGFHAACIDKWLRGHSSCPSCRRILAVQLPPGERCRRCGSSPDDWKPASHSRYTDLPPFLP